MRHRLIGEILLETTGLSQQGLEDALKVQEEKGGRIGEILIRQGAVTETDLLNALGIQFGLPVSTTLPSRDIDTSFAEQIPIQFLRKHKMAPIVTSEGAIVAINDPLLFQPLDDLRFLELKGLVSAYLPDDSSKKASKFKHPVNAQRQIIGELLVRAVICNSFGLANDENLFRYSEHKKPSLKNHNNIHFNISHSGDWVVCAVSAKEVGIDVEKIRETNFKIARRFFSNDEVKHLFALPKNQQLEYFFDLWTLKESYLKMLGSGLTKPLSSFTAMT
jgi:4'-phosphopantetheinyl transferase